MITKLHTGVAPVKPKNKADGPAVDLVPGLEPARVEPVGQRVRAAAPVVGVPLAEQELLHGGVRGGLGKVGWGGGGGAVEA